MIQNTVVKHKIQKYILTILAEQKYARFRDMRPPKVDTNLYSYHLKLLQKNSLVAKASLGYSLTLDGMAYCHRARADSGAMPDVVAMVIIQDGYGNSLLVRRTTQPFIDSWTLPTEPVKSSDDSIETAARRAVDRIFGDRSVTISRAGDCYIRIRQDEEIKLSTMVHVFRGATEAKVDRPTVQWVAPHKIARLDLVPGVEQVITRAFFGDPYFFEEYDVDIE